MNAVMIAKTVAELYVGEYGRKFFVVIMSRLAAA